MPWPKQRPSLNAEDLAISEDWQAFWLTRAQKQFSGIQRFNHEYVLRAGSKYRGPTLEIGAGDGEHIRLECEAGRNIADYHVIELREDLARMIRDRHPGVDVRVGDCQQLLPFAAGSLQCIIAIHVLEHLEDLPAFLRQAALALSPGGRLLAVIPCEGGVVYGIGRHFTSKRTFENRYKTSYDRFIRSEHVSTAAEVIEAVRNQFVIESVEWWPFRLPSVHLNVCVGLCLARIPHPTSQLR